MKQSRVTLAGLVATLFLLVALPACKTSGSAESGREAPAYARAGGNFRHFESADDLSAYLRFGSDAGPLISAHRGGPMPGFPENCIETLNRVLRLAPAIMEVDVRMSSDSVLVLMHDEELGRTSNGKGRVDAYPLHELRSVLLRDPAGILTPFRIPTLAEALAWSHSRAILSLDVKPGVPPESIVREIRRHGASNRVVIIVYNIPDLMAFAQIAPDLMYSVPAETTADFEAIRTAGVDHSRLLLWIGIGELRPELIQLAHDNDMRVMLGTFGEVDERARQAGITVYEHLLQSGVDVIATDRVADVAQAIARISVYSSP